MSVHKSIGDCLGLSPPLEGLGPKQEVLVKGLPTDRATTVCKPSKEGFGAIIGYLSDSQKNYYNVEEAKSSIRKNEIWALLRFSWNYTDSLKDRVLNGRDSTDDVVDHSFLDYWVDDTGECSRTIDRRPRPQDSR